jgi:23S rRNA (cytidine2498-2'-O)-methyltransferase
MHYLLCKDDRWTKTLQKEIIADYTKDCSIVEGFPLITIPQDVNLGHGHLAFCSTVLINAIKIAQATVTQQLNQIIEQLLPKIEKNSQINFHVFALTEKYGIVKTGRAEIFNAKIVLQLKKKNIKCLSKGLERSMAFLQILILADRSLIISYLSAEEMPLYHSLVSPFIGGFNYVADDALAPSRAFKKIIEAQLVMGKNITKDEVLVDLGACPGGWTYIARNNGARVIAIDRSPLHKRLMKDKLVQYIKADAFKYKATEDVDWVVSDIISEPKRILELIDYWILEKNCKHFIFTIKFKGQKDYGILKKFKNVANLCEFKIIIKQLNANKNEVTIMGSRIYDTSNQ